MGDLPPIGYSTTRFSDEQAGHKGGLDKFCNLERTFFFCAVLMMWVIPQCPKTYHR